MIPITVNTERIIQENVVHFNNHVYYRAFRMLHICFTHEFTI